MLCKVLLRSRLLAQFDEKIEEPNGDDVVGRRAARCGIEPALSRERRADFAAAGLLGPNAELSVGVPGPGLNGLVDGVGRDVLGRSEDCGMSPVGAPAGENREGKVPARALRVEVWAVVGSATG